jgi:hypothetical protein
MKWGRLFHSWRVPPPESFSLKQNYPNPFNPTTAITFTIPHLGDPVGTLHATSLQVFDLLGREVATLVNEVKEPGTYTVQWDATGLASGVYMYRLEAVSISDPARTYTQTRSMLLLK